MKCVLCDARKAKRYCPAKGTEICPQCCGTKRILEIDCPESCQYLQVGRSHEIAQEGPRHFWDSDPAKQQAHIRLFREFENEILYLEYVIAQERRSSRDLTDGDLAAALDLLLQTYRTEESGLLYERVSSDLRVDALRRQLRDVVQFLRFPEEDAQDRLRLRSAIEILELIRHFLSNHMGSGDPTSSYVDFLARTMPRDKDFRQSSSLILPG